MGNECVKVKGIIEVPGDKSISHRAVMLGGISRGETVIEGFLLSEDCMSTITCLRSLGVETSVDGSNVRVCGKGLRGLKKPEKILDAGNSGTTMRLMSGILAGLDFISTITGDESLRRRPMKRIIEPLQSMGAVVESGEGGVAPLTIKGGSLKAIDYTLPVPSAQVKSAVLLAGLYASGTTRVIEKLPSRNHTELMLKEFGASIEVSGSAIEISCSELEGCKVSVPGDISSAAFFIAAAASIPGSELTVRNVGINPTRTGVIDVLADMGADIEFDNIRNTGREMAADIIVRGRQLHGVTIDASIIPRLIDEIPVLAAIAARAEGTTLIRGAGELRVKESDRLAVVVSELKRLGADIKELEDGIEVKGPGCLRGGRVNSHGDHRIAMALAVCGLFTDEKVIIEGKDCVKISFPGFFDILKSVTV